jgi:periplasmic protein TonB
MSMQNNISETWDDIVFERRNKTYGAYVIRYFYSRNVIIAVAATLVFFALVLSWPAISRWLNTEEEPETVALKTVRYTDLAPPPPIDQNTPPPPKVDVPPVKKIIKFLPPKVTDKEVVEEEPMPTQDEVKQNDVGAESVEGTGEVIFDEPVQEVVKEEVDEDRIFTVVEQPASFEGGLEAMYKFISKHVKYPSGPKRMGIDGSVFVSFIIDRDGSISGVEIVKGLHMDLDKEAMRVVKMMPPWKPGKQNGKAVRSKFVLPIKFKLDNG